MADAESLKSFLIDVGFVIDSGSERRLQESLKRTQVGVERFSKSTHQSTGFLGQFFQFFQKSEGPMRQHTETTDKLAKSFDEFGKSLKGLVAAVAGGALTKALLDLNDQFTQLYYSAQQAGTSVANLMAAQFGAGQVGISAAQITTVLTALRHALQTIPGAGAVLGQLGVDVTKFLDPLTGKINDTTGALDALLPQIAKLYEQGATGAAKANAILQAIGITPGPEMERFFSHLEQVQKYLREEEVARGWAKQLGVDLDQAATNAAEVSNRFDDIWYILKVIKGSIEETFGPSAAGALEWFRDELLHLVDVAKEASAGMREAFKSGGFEGLGRYITQQLDAIDWNAEGAQLAQHIIDGIVALFRAGAGNQEKVRDALIAMLKGAFDEAMNDLRGWMAEHGLGWFPGVIPRPPPTVPAAPGSIDQAPGTPPQQYQQGGIVPTTGPAILHAGEGVVTADAMSGLSRLGPTIEDLWDGFRNWWFGAGSYRPGVVISNVDELAEALSERKLLDEKSHGADAGGDGGGGAGAGGEDEYPGNAGSVFADIAEQRRPLAEEVAGDPATKKLLMQMMATEGGGQATVEALFNRVAMIRQKIQGYKIKDELLSGFYGPIDRGEAQRTEISTRQAEQYQRILDRVVSGSNLIAGRVNQGSASDPGANLPGRIRIPGSSEIYNFWEGARRKIPFSVEDSMRFAEQEGRLANALAAAPLGTTNSYRAGDKTVTLNAQNNFSITGADALSVGGAINSAQSRINADLIRNLSPIVQ